MNNPEDIVFCCTVLPPIGLVTSILVGSLEVTLVNPSICSYGMHERLLKGACLHLTSNTQSDAILKTILPSTYHTLLLSSLAKPHAWFVRPCHEGFGLARLATKVPPPSSVEQ